MNTSVTNNRSINKEEFSLKSLTTIVETALGDSYKNVKNYPKAEIAYQHAVNMIPSRFYPHYLLAKLYEESEQVKKAVVIANQLLVKKIKIPSTAIKEMKAEMKQIIQKDSISSNQQP